MTTITEAKKMRSGVNVTAEVVSKGEPRTVNLKSGGTVEITEVQIQDDTGSMKLALWGDDGRQINVGDVVEITNGYTNEFKGEVSLTKGKYGTMVINP